MRSILIVVLVPSLSPGPGVEQISKLRRIQELLSQPAVNAFAVGALHRFAGSNVHSLNLLRDAPSLKLTAGELAAVVHANAPRFTVFGDGRLQLPNHSGALDPLALQLTQRQSGKPVQPPVSVARLFRLRPTSPHALRALIFV